MNKKQKKILIAVLIIMVWMLLIPPFHFRFGNGLTRNLGYKFILNPPSVNDFMTGTVDVGLLLTQWFGVGIIGAIAFFIAKDR